MKKPTCRYCGEEMEDDAYCWICPACHSSSPVVIWDGDTLNMTEEEKKQYAYIAATEWEPDDDASTGEIN